METIYVNYSESSLDIHIVPFTEFNPDPVFLKREAEYVRVIVESNKRRWRPREHEY
jgi:hypothetical protein